MLTGFGSMACMNYNPNQGKIAHGVNLGYVLTKYDQEVAGRH